MFGILVKIKYKGKHFDCFDEMKDKKTVKGVFKKYLEDKGIKLFKGIQQAGRTDSKVSAKMNYLYFQTKSINLDEFIEKEVNNLEILEMKVVKPHLVLPEIVKKREYIYHMPKKYIPLSKEKIQENIEIISKITNFIDFTDHKGKKLLNHSRNIQVRYEDSKLIFIGDSFLPKQVRIMSGYILKGKKEVMPAKYLYLNKVELEEKKL